MDWKAHTLIGCLFGAVGGSALLELNVAQLALFTAISGVSALLPDLDLRKSKFSQLLYAGMAVAILAAAYALSGNSGSPAQLALYAVLLAVAALVLDIHIRPRHRGAMHGLLFLAIITAAAWLLLGKFVSLALFLGYVSHLLADICVKAW